jgi:hypothetical protein
VSKKYYAIVIKPVLTFADVTSFDFERHELTGEDLDTEICNLLGEDDLRYPRVLRADAIGSMLLEDAGKMPFSIGFWIDEDAQDHGKIVSGKKTPAHLNSFATIIRRAAIGIQQGVNPITVAPVAGRVVIMGVDGEGEKNPYALSERRCDLAIAALLSLLGSNYIGDEEFDQMFLNAFISPTFEEDLENGMVSKGVTEETASRIVQRLSKISELYKRKKDDDAPTGVGKKGLVN